MFYSLILLGIIVTISAALMLSQLDTLQQQNSPPPATFAAADFDATLTAGDLPIIIITGEASQSESGAASTQLLPTPTARISSVQTPESVSPTPNAADFPVTPEGFTPEEFRVEETAESPTQNIVTPLCNSKPDGWLPYIVKENDTLRSLAIQSKVDEDTIATINCLAQPQLRTGHIIYLPIPLETMTPDDPPSKSQGP